MPSFFLAIILLCLVGQTLAATDLSLKDYLAAPANPINLTITRGPGKTTMPISASKGGVVTLLLSSGDLVEVSFPAGSVQKDTEITLQENTSIKHPKFPGDAKFLSVEISPDGTQLLKPAVLTFKLKNSIPLEKISPFTSGADGQDAIFAALQEPTNSKQVSISLFHFSNYNLPSGPSIDDVLNQGASANAQTRVANWINRQLVDTKQSGKNLDPEKLKEAFNEAFKEVVKPAFDAVNSCNSAKNALEVFLGWSRQVALLGGNPQNYFPPGFSENIGTATELLSEQCFETARKACYDDHQPVFATNFAFQILRQLIMNGASKEAEEKYNNFITKCNHYRFFMESEFWTGANRKNYTSVTAKADFEFDWDPRVINQVISGTLDVSDMNMEFEGMICSRKSLSTKPVQMKIQNFMANPENAAAFTVGLTNLIPGSQAVFNCRPKSGGQGMDIPLPMGAGQTDSYWGGTFTLNHGITGLKEFNFATGNFDIKNWEVRADHRMGAKHYSLSIAQGVNETTDMVIYHEPQPL